MFSRKPAFIILIKAHEVVLFRKGRLQVSLSVPLEAVQYLEIRDGAKLSAVLADFFKSQPFQGQHALILLDKSVVFQKMVLLDEKTSADEARADFAKKLPFNPDDGQMITIQQGGKLFFFGVNRKLHLAVKQVLEQLGAAVDAVTPASVYGVSENASIDSAKFGEIRDAAKTIKATDFLAH